MSLFRGLFRGVFRGLFGMQVPPVVLDGPLTAGAATAVRVACDDPEVVGRMQIGVLEVRRLLSDPVEVV